MKTKILMLLVLTAILYSCKPTEKNYQNAYDKALQAHQKRTEQMSTSSDGQRLEAIDAPSAETIDGETIFLSPVRVKVFEGDPSLKGPMGVAVAKYTMATNARRNVLDLKDEYPGAFFAFDGDESYYVIIDTASTSKDAAEIAKKYKDSRPANSFVGLSGNPLLITVTSK